MNKVDYSTSTALITGPTSGIGRSIAFEIVSKGIARLVLVGRQQSKLDQTADELRQKCSARQEIRTILADLTEREAGANVQSKVDEWGWSIDILINNAGVARKASFASKDDNALDCVDTLVRIVIDLSSRFLPGMLERRRGGLLNIGSTAAYQPVPWTATYAACKAFLLSWSQAVRQENLESGVRIACIVPGITKTNLNGQGGGEVRGLLDYVGIHKSDDVAKAALDAFERNSAAKILGLNNQLLRLSGVPVPASVMARVVATSRGAPVA
ncbi:Short-chain dehydrogenase/reductase SDR [Kalmanozyma brasiliensis GHG001]|uniref:Ketoreductase domain-containing protein n=1 Tax=Kalmanozyma brasiliensis (strain GHG001) TaxID=1365824 RepID=V5EUA3_KALBG|nr:Short-chain dehydrogenase/reductase SDR [Kalmanozyma brasiliensis GHG001]EST05669.1 Short-chain dehydrogenase/reductase SDR [Kalmanozyma brasiliensis GHG001]